MPDKVIYSLKLTCLLRVASVITTFLGRFLNFFVDFCSVFLGSSKKKKSCGFCFEAPHEAVMLWFTHLNHMFVFVFAFAIQLINHPFKTLETWRLVLCLLKVLWEKVHVKIQPEKYSFKATASCSYHWNQQMDCFDVFHIVSFFFLFFFLIRRLLKSG